MLPLARGPGLLAAWHQARGLLCLGGSAPVVRLWDADREAAVAAVPTDGPLSALALDPASGALLAAGDVEGGVCLYDLRAAGKGDCLLLRFPEPGAGGGIAGLAFAGGLALGGGPPRILCGTGGGDVVELDARNPAAPVAAWRAAAEGLQAFASHPAAPLVAWWALLVLFPVSCVL
jgi:hypothetical protein